MSDGYTETLARFPLPLLFKLKPLPPFTRKHARPPASVRKMVAPLPAAAAPRIPKFANFALDQFADLDSYTFTVHRTAELDFDVRTAFTRPVVARRNAAEERRHTASWSAAVALFALGASINVFPDVPLLLLFVYFASRFKYASLPESDEPSAVAATPRVAEPTVAVPARTTAVAVAPTAGLTEPATLTRRAQIGHAASSTVKGLVRVTRDLTRGVHYGQIVWALYSVAIPLNAAYLGVHLTRRETWLYSWLTAWRVIACAAAFLDAAYFKTALFLPHLVYAPLVFFASEPTATPVSAAYVAICGFAIHVIDFQKQVDRQPGYSPFLARASPPPPPAPAPSSPPAPAPAPPATEGP